jgi:membrane protease YdiL (CAAX protease family)
MFVIPIPLPCRKLRAFLRRVLILLMPWDFWLIFLVLGAVLPWRGYARLKKLQSIPKITSSDRLALYVSTIAFQWIAAALVGWRAWARGYSLAELGLLTQGRIGLLTPSIFGALVLATFQWFNLRRLGRLPEKLRVKFRSLAERLFPQSAIEMLLYSVLGVTAGICEEFLYRGFAMATLSHSGVPLGAVIAISSILFGLAHIYQGRGGFVSTLFIGTVFGIARIAYDSIVPVVFWHVAIDLVAGVAGPLFLLRGLRPTVG